MKKAFSLVEVVLALGIVSFALLAVVGLLPIGLKSVKNANENAGAANVLQAIAATVRSARSTDPTKPSLFNSRFAEKDLSYSLGGSSSSFQWTNLTLEGTQEDAAGNPPKRLSARLDIYPAAAAGEPNRAVISVAWSAQANPVWDPATQLWTKSEGSITSGIQFLAKQ